MITQGTHRFQRVTIEGGAVCDVCGKPATNWARDTVRYEGGSFVERGPVGGFKYGCDEHSTESEDIGRTLLPR